MEEEDNPYLHESITSCSFYSQYEKDQQMLFE
jgi:hypothetical protein